MSDKQEETKTGAVFEENLKRLEESAKKIKSDEISLAEAMQCFEDGMRYYRSCAEILADAGKKIEVMETEMNQEEE